MSNINKKNFKITLPLVPLTIILIILKLSGVIHWSWLWVIAPIWIPYAIIFGVWIIIALFGISFFITKGVSKKLKGVFHG